METALNQKQPFKIRVSGLNANVHWSGPNNTQADALTNHYYFSFYSDQAAGANAPTLDAEMRVTFDDL